RLFEVRACGFPQALTLIGCSFVKELSGPAGAASCSEVANYTHLTSTRQHGIRKFFKIQGENSLTA
ncbi:hypothetical protein, partial [Laribacter hongkongensis]|uniref:hypothetical protein n=1 Tax=Laribacter hongkongensis TaxID=168471 RepID=UPI001D0BF971